MSKPFTPRPYQQLISAHQIEVARNAVWAGMGLGKTSSTLNTLDALYRSGESTRPTLVLAPLRVAQSTWPDEAAKWDHLARIEVRPIVGTPKARREALRDTNATVFTMNYENLPWLVEHLGERGKGSPFENIVLDEATRVKGFRGSIQVSKLGKEFLRTDTGARAKALARLLPRARRVLELTGTPSPNGLGDLWAQLWFLDQGERLGRTHTAFIQRWFYPSPDGYGSLPLPFAQEQIQDRVRDICLSLEARDWFDLREPIINVIRVTLPKEARRLYEAMEKQMFMELAGGHEVEAFGGAAKTLKCLQLANGAAYVGDGTTEFVEVHDAKLQALESVVEEAAGAPILVAYHFKSDLARLQRAFPKGRALDSDPQTIRDWNAGRIPLLFAHPASAGHGLNLQDGGNTLVFFGMNWNLEEHLQIIERIGPTRQMQAGHDRPVFIHYIVAEGTVDDLVRLRLETKREVQDILMEAMKRGTT